MRYHNITKCDMLNGEGVRVVLWLSHCEHNCKGCQNPQTRDRNGGIPFDEVSKLELIKALSNDNINGITFSGGDPLSTLNRKEVLELAKEIKLLFPSKDIWLYTGYDWEEIKYLKNLKFIDVLVDGEYMEEFNFPSPKWCGSSNQKIVNVKKTLDVKKVVLYEQS